MIIAILSTRMVSFLLLMSISMAGVKLKEQNTITATVDEEEAPCKQMIWQNSFRNITKSYIVRWVAVIKVSLS